MSQKLASILKITAYHDAPGNTAAHDVGWVDMSNYESFLASYLRTSGTGGLAYKILANSDSAGGGTDVTVATGTATPDTDGDYCFLEVSAADVQAAAATAGTTARYVSLNLTNATSGDEGAVTYILGRGKGAKDLTADSIA